MFPENSSANTVQSPKLSIRSTMNVPEQRSATNRRVRIGTHTPVSRQRKKCDEDRSCDNSRGDNGRASENWTTGAAISACRNRVFHFSKETARELWSIRNKR